MIQYLKADLWRINRRTPRVIIFALYLIMGVILTIINSNQKSYNFIKFGEGIASILGYLPFFLALLNLYFVFEDDLQVKTMQVAIGRGVRRWSVIFAKWCEMIILSVIDCAVMLVLMCGVGLLKGVTLKGYAASKVAAQISGTLLTIGVITALTMIVIFQIMHLGFTQLLFFILFLKPVTLIISYQEVSNEFMAKLNLSRVLIGSNLDGFQMSLESGQFNLWNLIVILMYWGIGMGVTYILFRKKELDF